MLILLLKIYTMENYKKDYTKTNKKSKLKELRKAAGLTQAELSEKTGLSLSLIKKYEQETKNIHNAQYATIIKLCGFLDCDPEDLL